MPPTRVPRCGALVVVVAVLAHRVPRLRRGRVPASAPASGVRVVDVPASREPRPDDGAACSRPSSGVRGARAPRAVCSSPECRAPAERAAPAPRAPRWPCARVECAAPSPSERRGGRACDERAVCSRRACGGWPWPCARDERAVCPRRGSRAPAPRAVLVVRVPCARVEGAVCSCRWSGRGVLASSVPPRPSPACGAVALAPSVPSCSRSECRGRVPPSREPSRTSRGSRAVCPRPECRRALDEGAVRWCRGRRVRMVDVPSPSVPH